MITLERELKWKRVGAALAVVFCLVGIGWQTVMNRTIETRRDQFDTTWAMRGIGPDYPAYYVTWINVQTFIRRMNDLEGTVLVSITYGS